MVEAARSDYAPLGTCEALPTRQVMPVRDYRLAQAVVLDPSASESDAQSSSSDSSDSESESSGSSGSESSQSTCSSNMDSDTHNCKPSKAARHSPLVPKPNPKSVTAPGTLGVTRGPHAHPVPNVRQYLAPFVVNPVLLVATAWWMHCCNQLQNISSAAPGERPKKFRCGDNASSRSPSPSESHHQNISIYINYYPAQPLSCFTTHDHCSAAPLSILQGGRGGGEPALRESVPRSGTCDWPRVAMVAETASL